MITKTIQSISIHSSRPRVTKDITIVKMYVIRRFSFSENVFFFQGFYTVYNKLFKDIAEQDLKASSDKKIEIPDFGNSESDYDEVRDEFNGLE